MKRRILALIVISVTLLTSGCMQKAENTTPSIETDTDSSLEIAASSVEESTGSADDYIFEKPIIENIGDGFELAIDPKIESAYMVFEMVSDDTGFSQYKDSAYMRNQIEHFKKFKDHEVFEIARKMANDKFTYDAIPSALHFFDDDSKLREGIILDEQILYRAGGMENIEALGNALVDFRRISDYDSYFKSNYGFYERSLIIAKSHINNSGLYDEFLDHYGYEAGNIRVTITPDSMGGYGCSNEYSDHIDLMPTLTTIDDEKAYAKFLLHEFSHPYVNPETDVRMDLVYEKEELYEPIKKIMTDQAYNQWYISLNEHIVRANTIYMMTEIYGEDIEKELIEKEKDRGFVYIEQIYDSIKKYESNRDKYLDFSQYFDTLMSDVEKIDPIS